jgi:sugar phosphate isomerase/epimerase
MRAKIFVQPPNDDSFDAFLDYAREYGYNLEIASFAYSAILDSGWQSTVKDYQRKLKEFEGIVSAHGAFQDLIIHSRDSKVKEAARQRVFQNLDISRELNAKYIVFHANFNPLIGHESYRRNWLEQNVSFWSEVLNKYDVTVLLENVWEPTPEIFKALLNAVNSPYLKVCFDTGHANIFSRVPFEEWFSVLRDNIPYMHVNDNKGKIDSELAPGQGTIDWTGFSDLIQKYQLTPDIVFEVGTLEKTRQSLEYFQKRNIYPFNQALQ